MVWLILAMALPGIADAKHARFREGQVWAYRTRTGDEGSLLKIQAIEKQGQTTIYHLSVIGLHFRTAGVAGILPHEPIAQDALERSVTTLRADPGTFPPAAEGIAEWRRAHGGVYTITVAETIEVLDRTLAAQPATSQ